VFPVRYELSTYIILGRNSVLKGLREHNIKKINVIAGISTKKIREHLMYEL
jgi:hypothetical protein